MDTEYPRFHQDRGNLALHLVMVPVFVGCSLGALWSLAAGAWLQAALLSAGPVVSLAVQGVGHKRELVPPLPFAGPGDFVKRVFLEQFYRFPAFVLSGGWHRAWRGAGRDASRP